MLRRLLLCNFRCRLKIKRDTCAILWVNSRDRGDHNMPDRRKLHEGLRWPRTQSTEREEAWQRLEPVLATMGLMLHLRHHTRSFIYSTFPFSHLYLHTATQKYYLPKVSYYMHLLHISVFHLEFYSTFVLYLILFCLKYRWLTLRWYTYITEVTWFTW